MDIGSQLAPVWVPPYVWCVTNQPLEKTCCIARVRKDATSKYLRHLCLNELSYANITFYIISIKFQYSFMCLLLTKDLFQ